MEKLPAGDALAALVVPTGLAIQCATKDQKSRLRDITDHYRDIGAELAAYFAGVPSPFQRESPQGRLIASEAAYYLSLYNLLFFGWESLESAANRDWETLGPALSIYQSTPFPKCPGDALKLAIGLDCEAGMLKALGDGSISVRASRKVLRGKGSTLPGTYGGDVLEIAPPFNEWIVLAIKRRLNGRSDLRGHLKHYESKLRARNKTINQMLVAVRGERWRDGYRRRN
jgi:hypothetical protein